MTPEQPKTGGRIQLLVLGAAILLVAGAGYISVFGWPQFHPAASPMDYLNASSVSLTTDSPGLVNSIGNFAGHPWLSLVAEMAPTGFSLYRATANSYSIAIGSTVVGSIQSNTTLFDVGLHQCAHLSLSIAADTSLNVKESLKNATSIQPCING